MASGNAESSRKPAVDAWIGTNIGVLKGVSLGGHEVSSHHPSSLGKADRSQEVCALCWEHQSEGEWLYCALRSGVVQRFNCQEKAFEAECDCTGGEGVFVGLGKHEEVLITCTDQGSLCFWPQEDEKISCFVGNGTSCMVASPDTLLQVATGGKETDLKVWDANNTTSPLFHAKNVKNDKLDLHVPVWVTAIGYVPTTGAQPTLAVATGYHQVRLYDTRAQRRPVYSQEYGDHPFTALTMVEDGRSYVVGNSIGDIMRCDLRTGKALSRYTGCTGGVKGLQCCTTSGNDRTMLASCSLDRYLRVYSLDSPKLLHKVYLKLLPSKLLFSETKERAKECSEERVSIGKHVAAGEGMDSEEEEDEEDSVWKKMKVVGERPSKTKSATKTKKVRRKRKAESRSAKLHVI